MYFSNGFGKEYTKKLAPLLGMVKHLHKLLLRYFLVFINPWPCQQAV